MSFEWKLVILFGVLQYVACQDLECPQHWVRYSQSCYKFIRSPLKNRDTAFVGCQFYNAYLVSVNTMDENSFIMDWLRSNDPQHRSWYTSGVDVGNNVWRWQGDDTPFINMDLAFVPEALANHNKFAVYGYSDASNRWGLFKVSGIQDLPYICEVSINLVRIVVSEYRDFDYGEMVVDPERVHRAPYFIKEPQDAVFDISGRSDLNEVSLRCVAGGFPFPSYKWYKEGKEVNALSDMRITQMDGTLTIYKPEQLKDRGTYHCTATNQYGTVMSQSVQLNFGYIGQFNLKRSPESGRENWGKAIFCDPPQHYPEVNYYWSRDKLENLVEEDRRVFVSRDGNLYFSSLETIDRGMYSCMVQSPVSSTGRTGPFFPLEVLPYSSNQQLQFPNNFPKSFPEAPIAGDDVRLECIAFGYPVPYYNWTRKGYSSSLPRASSTAQDKRVLILPKVAVEDSGEYVCTASNEKSSVIASVTLSIQAKPMFTIPLDNMHLDKGADLTWNCEAFGNPEVEYDWLRNGKPLRGAISLQDAPRYIIRENVLTIRSLMPDKDQGVYQCKATNQLGSTYSSAELRVLTLPPSFKKYPVAPVTYAAENDNTTIQCRSEGAPTPKFQWRRNGQPVNPDGRVVVQRNGNLVINQVRFSDEGRYTCSAVNEFGRAESDGMLKVIRQPSFVQRPRTPVYAAVNDVVRLDCEVEADPEMDLAYIWRVNGIRIDAFKHHRFDVGPEPGKLNVYNLSFYDQGVYECQATTPYNTVSAFSTILVEGPPGEVGGLQTLSTASRNIKLIWTDGPSYGKQILSYDIEGRTRWNSTWVIILKDIEARPVGPPINGRRETEIDSNLLSPWSQFEFRIIPKNIYGLGPPSDPSPAFLTKEDRPYKWPENIGGGGGNAGDLTITWTPLPKENQNAPGIWYKVYYKAADAENSPFKTMDMKDEGDIGQKVLIIGQSNYYKEYKVKVQAFNKIGAGPVSPEVVILSAEDRPRVTPNEVGARSYNSTAINVTWQPIDLSRESIRGQLIGFRIKYWRRDLDTVDDATYQLSRSIENWAIIVGLQNYTYYTVVVMAYNAAGSGPESEPFIERTFKSAPLKPPTSVMIEPTGFTSVRVTFRAAAPSQVEEPLIGFKVRYWESDQDFSLAKDVLVPLGLDNSAIVRDLTPGKTYKLRVLAYSQGGDGRMSSPAYEFQLQSSASKLTTTFLLPWLIGLFSLIYFQI